MPPRRQGHALGAWLIPERGPRERLHYHGVVVTPEPDDVERVWRLCGGGSPYAQDVKRLDLGDRANVRRAIAYTMKGAHYPFHGTIATGLMGSPWAFASGGTEPDGATEAAACRSVALVPAVGA